MTSPQITADDLYAFIVRNAEEINGQLVCRASLMGELRRLGVPDRQQTRIRLVKELEARGLVKRINPRSRWLLVTAARRPSLTAHMDETQRVVAPGYSDPQEALSKGTSRYNHDRRATRRRIGELETYMSAEVLAQGKFVCRSWRECAQSVAAKYTFTEGQLSHVGKHFDLRSPRGAFRIVVIGQERGGQQSRIAMPDRWREVHDGSGMNKRLTPEGSHKRRNPHMRGTTLALRTIFGIRGTGHEAEFLDVDGAPVHLFDCFALVNRLICAAHLERTNGKPTTTMFANCERHFRATLEILQPTIVVIQWVKVWKWSQSTLVPTRRRSDALYECDLTGLPVIVAALSHPSSWGASRWDSPTSPYFTQVVRPTLRRAVALSQGQA